MCGFLIQTALTVFVVSICGAGVSHMTMYKSLDDNLHSLFRFITNGSVISRGDLDVFLGKLGLRPHDHVHEEEAHTHYENATHCYSADDMFNLFPSTVGLSEKQLEQLLPTVMYEICTDACHHEHDEHTSESVSPYQRLGWKPISATVAAVLILCASGLVVVVILPLMSRSFYHVVTQFLIALSVGSLTGDAFLHLIPHGISGHDHSHSHEHGADSHSSHRDMVVKSLVALMGVYLFFLTERLTILFQNTKSRRKMKRQWSASVDHRHPHDHLEKDGRPISVDTGDGGDHWPTKLATPDTNGKTGHPNYTLTVNDNPAGSTPFDENRLCIRPTERPLNNARCEDHLNDNSPFRVVPSLSKDVGGKNRDLSDGIVQFWPTSIYGNGERDMSAKDPKDDGGGGGTTISFEKALLPTVTPATSQESLSHVVDTPSAHLKVAQAIRRGKSVSDVARTSSHGGTGSEATHPHRDKPHGHHHGHSHDLSSVRAIAYTVIVGDGLHNFCDGIAVGAAFANSLRGGLSTSIAVLCHELPHELGDFAVLLHAGMSIKAALFYNFLSGILCAVGAAIGLVLGQVEHIDTWLFMLTAGMFVYIALVDMIPELSTNRLKGHRFCHRPSVLFFWQNCGMLIGFGIMLLIAFFEDSLKNGL